MTTYLYGENFDPIVLATQKSVAEYKIVRAKTLLVKLQEEDLESRDIARINKVLKAIEFNERLINERI